MSRKPKTPSSPGLEIVLTKLVGELQMRLDAIAAIYEDTGLPPWGELPERIRREVYALAAGRPKRELRAALKRWGKP